MATEEDLNPEGFEKPQDPERWADRGGLPWDELGKGMLVTVLKNRTSMMPLLMSSMPPEGTPGMEEDYSQPGQKMENIANILKSLSQDFTGGGIVLQVTAINRPYVVLKAWDVVAQSWMQRPVTRDLRITSFIRVKQEYAQALGVPPQ